MIFLCDSSDSPVGGDTDQIMEKLRDELEEEKAQKSFYENGFKTKTKEVEDMKAKLDEVNRKLMAVENDSMSKKAEAKRATDALEEKEADISQLHRDKEGLRAQVLFI